MTNLPATFCNYRNDFDTGIPTCVPHGEPYPCPNDAEAQAKKPVTLRGPREHIERAVPPWRTLNPRTPGALTECSRPVGPRTKVITRAVVEDRLAASRDYAKKFEALPGLVRRERHKAASAEFRKMRDEAMRGVCGICRNKVRLHAVWDKDPAALLTREYEGPAAQSDALNAELRALALLAAAHPEEFRALLSGDVAHLGSRRRA